ncbi:MAG: DUF6498-containing protein [Bacteroidales bacterium]|nr:DUF6498-containing protein [Bacteroidales bacterium]
MKDRSIIFLIAVNLFPLLGVLFFDWDAIMIVMFYCIETFIIGLFNAAKMILSKVDSPQKYLSENKTSNGQFTDIQGNPGCIKIFLVPFFLFHYNIFVISQTVAIYFISTEFFENEISIQNFLTYDFIVTVLLIILSHAYSFYKNYIGKEEYKKISVQQLMSLPYKRIIIQQVTVIAGVFLIILFQGPIGFLILLIGLKLIVDIRAHNKSHKDNNSFLDKMIDLQKGRNIK